jgi:PST family polysaccharide transporter
MALLRTSVWNGLAVSVRMASALVVNKILAVLVGPGGYALIGQFQNGVTVVIAFATGALGTGVTKYTAEYGDDREAQIRLWRTAGSITLAASCASASAVVIGSVPLARWLLGDAGYYAVFLWLAAALVLIGFNALLLSILQGRKELRRFVVAGIAGSLIGLAVTVGLSLSFGLYGALIALTVNQALTFFVTLQQSMSADWFSWRNLLGPIDRAIAIKLGRYVLMAAATALSGPLSLIAVRQHLAAAFGMNYAGYWDAMWRISTLYLTFVTTTLSLYYLPRLSELRDLRDVHGEIVRSFRLVVPAVAVMSLAVFLSRDLIIRILFTESFLPMRDLFGWQMAGDVVKIASWMLAFVMLGRAMTGLFIVTEIAFAALFWGATVALTPTLGFKGVAVAHLATYTAYLATLYWLIFRNMGEAHGSG